MAYYLKRADNGELHDLSTITQSTGVADQDKLVATDNTGKLDVSLLPPVHRSQIFQTNTETITSQRNLVFEDDYYQFLTPIGTQIVNLPSALTVPDLSFKIANISDAGSGIIRIYEDNTTELLLLSRRRMVEVVSDGLDWYIFLIV